MDKGAIIGVGTLLSALILFTLAILFYGIYVHRRHERAQLDAASTAPTASIWAWQPFGRQCRLDLEAGSPGPENARIHTLHLPNEVRNSTDAKVVTPGCGGMPVVEIHELPRAKPKRNINDLVR